MDHRPQCKTQNYKTVEDNRGKFISGCEFGKNVLGKTLKA